MMLVLRLLHIGAGVFWAGTILFFGLLLEPSVRAAGPAGGQVMRELQARRYSMIMPAAGLIAILSGFELLRRGIPGGPAMWVAAPSGRVFLIGATAAVLTILLGIFVVLPSLKRIGTLAPRAAEDAAAAAELGRLRQRVTRTGRLATALVAVTVVTMAIARYV